MSEILDSGNRREFATGAVRDMAGGKGRCDLIPLDVAAHVMVGGDERTADAIIDDIALFQMSGEVSHLYYALRIMKCAFGGAETMLLEVSKHYEAGNEKYPPAEDGTPNWKLGIPVRSYIDSAVRHYLKWLRGDKDEPHDRAFVWNIMCAIWTCQHKPELNDYAKGGK